MRPEDHTFRDPSQDFPSSSDFSLHLSARFYFPVDKMKIKNLPLSMEWGQGAELRASFPQGNFLKVSAYSSFRSICRLISHLMPWCLSLALNLLDAFSESIPMKT